MYLLIALVVLTWIGIPPGARTAPRVSGTKEGYRRKRKTHPRGKACPITLVPIVFSNCEILPRTGRAIKGRRMARRSLWRWPLYLREYTPTPCNAYNLGVCTSCSSLNLFSCSQKLRKFVGSPFKNGSNFKVIGGLAITRTIQKVTSNMMGKNPKRGEHMSKYIVTPGPF